MKMRVGPYMEVGVDPEKMSPLPRLVYYNSMILGLGSLAAAYTYATLSSDISLGVFIGLGVFGCIALDSAFVSGHIYEKQKRKLGIGNYKTEKGKFYDRVCLASIVVAASSLVSAIPLLFGFSLDGFFSAMAFHCIAQGAMHASAELRDCANSYKLQRGAVGSLDESRGRESTGFISKLRNFNLIGSFTKKREDSDKLELLKRFNKEEEGDEDSVRTRVLLSNSNPGYGATSRTTTVL